MIILDDIHFLYLLFLIVEVWNISLLLFVKMFCYLIFILFVFGVGFYLCSGFVFIYCC